ncbi:MAG: hypothetical protein ACI4VK_06460 [Candidatus Coproplasma sp.]
MKRFLKAMTAVLAVVLMAFAFAGCTANVSGKTYVYSEVVAVVPDDATTFEEALIVSGKVAVEATYKNSELTFNEDGSFGSLSTWTQDGKTVTVKTGDTVTATYTVKGNKLEQSYVYEDTTYTIVFVESK